MIIKILKKYVPIFFIEEGKLFFYRLKFRNSMILSPYIDNKSVLKGYNKVLRNSEIYNSEIDRFSYVNFNSIISYCEIGKFTSIGSNCTIGTASHPINFLSTSPYTYRSRETSNYFDFNAEFSSYKEKTIIGNDCWIGNNVVIMQGIHIGDGAVIGAGSVVTKDVEKYSIVAGVPAKELKKRFDNEKILFLENNNLSNWWNECEENPNKFKKYFEKKEEWYKNI